MSSKKLPLSIATEADNIDAVLHLLTEAELNAEGGAAMLVNAKDPENFGMTAMHEASYSNQVEMVRILLGNYSHNAAEGGAVGRIPVEGNAEIQNLAPGQQTEDAGSNAGSVGGGAGENVDLDIQDDHGWTPLMCTVINNYLEIFKVLLEHGASVDFANQDGSTALTLAAEKNHGESFEMTQLLIDRGANLDAVEHNKEGFTALMLAAKNNHREVFDILVKSGAKVNHQDKLGRTALYCLCDNSWTALMVAATDNRAEMVEKICKAGADVNLADNEGETPIHVASKWGHPEVVEALLKHGAKGDGEKLLQEAKDRKIAQRSTIEGKQAQAELEERRAFAEAVKGSSGPAAATAGGDEAATLETEADVQEWLTNLEAGGEKADMFNNALAATEKAIASEEKRQAEEAENEAKKKQKERYEAALALADQMDREEAEERERVAAEKRKQQAEDDDDLPPLEESK